MDFRPILYIVGSLLVILSIGMILPMMADIYFGNEDWKVFFFCIIITAFFGGSLILTNMGDSFKIKTKQAFMMMSLSWLALALFAALPFKLTGLDLNFTDAFFEAMSGLTTTGSTVIVGLEDAPPGILLWRAILQWLGGVGIIISAMSILPFLNIGGMQIFRVELSENEKVLPRAAQIASSIGLIYVVLTLACIVAYMATGFNTFDAIAHAMTTISTGGFSTYDSSFSNFQNPASDVVCIAFMLLGSIPFVLYLKAAHGNLKPFFKDTQVRWFFGIVTFIIITVVLNLVIQYDKAPLEALRLGAFNIVSLITGTGFTKGDYGLWGSFAISVLLFTMAIGGCAGSTTCGIKIFRFQVFYQIAVVQFKKLLHPNGVFVTNYNGRPLPADIPLSVMSFLFLYAICFTLVAIALSLVGLDFMTAMSGAITSISNVGPGMGDIIGPTGSFAPLPDSAKWILSLSMFLGRLEIFTVLVMLTPQFWRR